MHGIDLNFQLRTSKTNAAIPLDPSAPCIWDSEQHLWISVGGASGGTDVYCCDVDDFDLEFWSSEFSINARANQHKETINACLSNGRYWNFRRSMGQPAIISFAYGILAGLLAELTEGVVVSDDSAWDYARFPATSHEVYEWYFNPAMALDRKYGDWAKECLALIASDGRK